MCFKFKVFNWTSLIIWYLYRKRIFKKKLSQLSADILIMSAKYKKPKLKIIKNLYRACGKEFIYGLLDNQYVVFNSPFNIDKKKPFRALFYEMVQYGANLYNLILRIENIEKIVIFNGRFPAFGLPIYALLKRNYNVEILEKTALYPKDRWIAWSDWFWHTNKIIDKLNEKLSLINEDELISEGKLFFEQRTNNPELKKYFSDDIKKSKSFDICYFNSSIDEAVGNPESLSEILYREDKINQLLKKCYKLGYSVAYRMHPNIRCKSKEEIEYWRKLSQELRNNGIVVFDAYSKVNSYELINNSKFIFVCNSTVGAEASYIGKVVIGFNPMVITSLMNVLYIRNPSIFNVEELNTLKPIDQINAIKYGYFNRSFGTESSLLGESSTITV